MGREERRLALGLDALLFLTLQLFDALGRRRELQPDPPRIALVESWHMSMCLSGTRKPAFWGIEIVVCTRSSHAACAESFGVSLLACLSREERIL